MPAIRRDATVREVAGHLIHALRRPGVIDNAQAWQRVRTIAGWKPLPLQAVKRRANVRLDLTSLVQSGAFLDTTWPGGFERL